tara:strand:- start:4343 stop:6025 length:1683 start_codon:yes stop_codon:yes gene_type:complete
MKRNYIKKFLRLVNSKMRIFIAILIIIISFQANSQNYGGLSGNFQLNYQTFQEDSSINAEARKPYTSGYTNLLYNYNQFTVGARIEAYNNTIPGFSEYEGYGISNKFIQFKNKIVDVTVGDFYDEFGSGLIFRTYFDPNLGVDNAIEGLRLKLIPVEGVYITGLIGTQRSYWEQSDVLIRAFNTDISINTLFLQSWNSYVNIGFSFVTKKEDDTNPLYVLPENVGALNGRMSVTKGNTSINLDYAYKINDPSAENNYIYKNGTGLILTANYSQKGMGISMGIKRIDNMSFRSERNAMLQDLNINYITPFTKQQAYSLATMYPYSSQPNGEMGSQIDIYYMIPKKSKLGGKYGTHITMNFSNVFNIHKTLSDDTSVLNESGTIGYNSNFLELGDTKLFQEFNFEISKKINRNLKIISTYINVVNNDKILKSQPILPNKDNEIIKANIIILESLIKLPSFKSMRNSMKTEFQYLHTKQHYGNWVMGLIEYKLSKLFFSLQDLYNYEHPEKPHYYSTSIGYNNGSNRVSITYGKQRAGLFCVGGVCREVPASNGFLISLTSSF